ncbi:protein of unknown function [Candidatus Nitrospira inopinata]|uniref:Uncharacterized protein n=1 Tax=Candidatus Nitrospira inopinata TaxID=1715989 RepID=A0A0S4KTU7_9BACT|nr:protein of unknown function [Candidatus Nitrospira inopinata]
MIHKPAEEPFFSGRTGAGVYHNLMRRDRADRLVHWFSRTSSFLMFQRNLLEVEFPYRNSMIIIHHQGLTPKVAPGGCR